MLSNHQLAIALHFRFPPTLLTSTHAISKCVPRTHVDAHYNVIDAIKTFS